MNRLRLAFALLFSIVNVVRAAPSADTHVLLMDDFESYTNTAAMRSVWGGGTAELANDVPGGGHAASHDGGGMNNLTGIAARPDAQHNVLFSADFYDYATNTDKRVTIVLKNSSGDNIEFGMVQKTHTYAVRLSGFATPTDWIPFDANIQPVPGWHRFQAIISLSNTVASLDLKRGGLPDATVCFDGPAPEKPFKIIRFGGLTDRKSAGGPVLVDNVEVALIPADGSVPTLAIHPAAYVPLSAFHLAPAAPAIITQPATEHNLALWWILAALGIIIGLLGALLLTLRRGPRAGPGALAMATVPPTISGLNNPGQTQVFPAELTEFAKQSLVQGLYTQRQALLETQQRAQQELAQLEARLSGLQLPLQERIRAYEKRIAELEKQLDSRGAEMQELTQVTLRLVREKLAEEKERQRTDGGSRFN